MPTSPTKKRYTYTIKDFYKDYRDQLKDEDVPCDEIIDYRLYREIIEEFFLEISRRVIYDNFTFMMPYSLGSVFIKAYKSSASNLPINWAKTRELGRVVKHLNLHTFGYYFGFKWDKSYVRFRNNNYYVFTPTASRKASRLGIGKKGLSKHIFDLAKDPEKRSYIKI